MAIRRNSPLESFYSVDTTSGCWNWLGAIDKTGYGHYTVGVKNYTSHKFVYTKYKGEVAKWLELDHTCNNRKCVNPEHLEPVTKLVNVRRSSATKLTIWMAAKIKERLPFEKDSKIAQDFKVARQTIHSIRRRESWIEA
jgi:hypothetical protein